MVVPADRDYHRKPSFQDDLQCLNIDSIRVKLDVFDAVSDARKQVVVDIDHATDLSNAAGERQN